MAKNQESSAEKMGTMPVGKLLATMALPAMCSMLVQSLYNVVDSIFVARISEDALTAVSLAFPMQMLILAFSLGASVGTNSLIARRLGEGRQKDASDAANNGLFIAGIISILFMILGLFFVRPFLSLFPADPATTEMAVQYLRIVMIFSFGMHIAGMGEKILQSTGNMIIPMISQLVGAVVNIILDPIMIFGLLGFPALGVAGAAIATVIGQMMAMTYVLIMLAVRSHDVHITFRHFRPNPVAIRDIIAVGLPVMVMNAIGSFTTTFMNKILIGFSSTAVAVMGVYFKLQSFVFMPVFGLTQGAMPIMGYNFGANNRNRFIKTLKLSLLTAGVIMTLGTLLFWTFPEPLLRLFDAGEQMLEIGTVALRAVSLSFIGAAAGIILSTMFQSMGHGFLSLCMSLLRQLIVILPAAWILGRVFGLSGVWFAYPIAEYVCIAVFIPLALVTVRREFAVREGKGEKKENSGGDRTNA